MSKVVVIGDTVADFLLQLPRNLQHKLINQGKVELPLGSKIPLSDYQLLTGGCGANIAVGLKRLGIKPELITSFGDDAIGEQLNRKLRDQVTIHSSSVSHTPISMIIYSNNDRTILTSRPDDLFKGKLDIPTSDWIFVCPLPEKAVDVLKNVGEHQVKHQSRVIINPSMAMIQERSREFLTFLRSVEILVLNREEALQLTRVSWQSDLGEIAKALSHLGPKVICLTDGAKGAWVQMGSLKRFSKRLVDQSSVIDSTGAGDAFGSGFLAGYILAQKKTLSDAELIEEAFSYGLLNSAGVVAQIGAQAGLQTVTEIERDLRYVKLEVR